MVVDIHGHVSTHPPDEASPAALQAYAGAARLEHLLLSNRDAARSGSGYDHHETDANVACLNVCSDNPRLVPLYWARPGQIDSNIHAFAGALASEPFAGVTFSPAANCYAADSPLLDPYLAVMDRLGLPGVFHTAPTPAAEPLAVYHLAKRHRQVALVLCDALTGPNRSEALDLVRWARERSDAQLYLDTAHASVDEIVTAVEAVGAARILFGTDAPCHGPTHARRCLKLLDELRAALEPGDFARLTSANARRLFRIERGVQRAQAPVPVHV
ncbi:MAG: amidohydrolase family protein [Planctomycetes bacterium]|nr:amidohydrolase family protein [Planctomycetota bacterium]